MKYGLIYYHDTHNLGDDILSYAGKQFLPQVDYYIDREHLDVFIPDNREHVAVIANGWYLHYNYTFQPSPYLYPLFIGTHLSKDEILFNDYSYIDASLVKYLQNHGPIGCRDLHTAKILEEKQVPSYFSGCMTLTLQKFPDVTPNHKVILVDVPDEITEYVQNLLPEREILCKTHRLQEEEAKLEWEPREKRLTEYLKLYQGADLVVTTRLHCALPCLALGTPVLFIANFNEDYHIRIESFSEYFPCYSTEDILQHKADSDLQNPQPPKSVEKLATPLIEKCNAFIQNTIAAPPENSALPELSDYQELYIDRTQYMRYTINCLYQIRYHLSHQLAAHTADINKTVDLCNKVLAENEELKRRIKELS